MLQIHTRNISHPLPSPWQQCLRELPQTYFISILPVFLYYSINQINDESTYVEIERQLDATDEFLLQILLLAQHVSGTIMPIIRSSRVLYKCLLPVVFGAVCGLLSSSPQTGHTTLSSTPYRQLENQSTKYHRQQPLV